MLMNGTIQLYREVKRANNIGAFLLSDKSICVGSIIGQNNYFVQ